jgi:alkylation response protein AidB-like acyl-CoA dehydrogenase
LRSWIHGLNVAEEYGGQGGNVIDVMILDEEISREFRFWPLAWNVMLYGNSIIRENGSESKRKYLPVGQW